MSADGGLTTRWEAPSREEGSLRWWPTQELLTTFEGSMALEEEEGDDEIPPLLAVVPPPEEAELMLTAKVPLQRPLGDGEGFSRPCSRSLSLNCVLAIEQRRGGSDGRFLLQQQEDYEEDEDEGPFLYRLSKTLPLSFSCGGGGCLSRVRCLFFLRCLPPPFSIDGGGASLAVENGESSSSFTW